MDCLKTSRDSRGGKFWELPHFPAIPAPPLGGGNWREGNCGRNTCQPQCRSLRDGTLKCVPIGGRATALYA